MSIASTLLSLCKHLNVIVCIRYKIILDNQGSKKSGRGAKRWRFFDDMDEIYGQRASSVSLRLAARGSAPSTTTTTSSSVENNSSSLPKTASSAATSSSVEKNSSSLLKPASESDDDDVVETGSLKEKATVARVAKRKKSDNTPKWFCEAESRISKSQDEWRQELRLRMDTQEKMQAERLDVLRETNNILKQLLHVSRNES